MITPVIDKLVTTSSDACLKIRGIERQITELQKEIRQKQSYIARLNSRIQRFVLVDLKILDSHLQAVQEERGNDSWDISRLQQSIRKKLEETSDELMIGHSNWLDEEMQKYSENGTPSQALDGEKEATPEKGKATNKNLLKSFEKTLNLKLEESKKKYPVDVSTDLEKLERELEKNKAAQFAEYQMWVRKSEGYKQQIEKLKNTIHEKTNQLEDEVDLSDKNDTSPKVIIDDPFKASQLGDLTYLKKMHFKLHFYERSGFVKKTCEIDEEKFNFLHFASFHGRLDVVKQLVVEWKADIKAKSIKGYTALHWAAKAGKTEVADFLLNQIGGKDLIDAKADEFDRTPLHLAVFNGKIETTGLLIDSGADINAHVNEKEQLKTPLHYAVTQNNLEMVKTLTSYASLDVNQRCSKGLTPLYYAVLSRDFEIVRCILKHSSFLDCEDPQDPNSLKNIVEKHKEDRTKELNEDPPKEEDPLKEEIIDYLLLKLDTDQ